MSRGSCGLQVILDHLTRKCHWVCIYQQWYWMVFHWQISISIKLITYRNIAWNIPPFTFTFHMCSVHARTCIKWALHFGNTLSNIFVFPLLLCVDRELVKTLFIYLVVLCWHHEAELMAPPANHWKGPFDPAFSPWPPSTFPVITKIAQGCLSWTDWCKRP